MQACVLLPCVYDSKHLTQLVRDFSFKSTYTSGATSQKLLMTFCNGSGEILSGISALCPGGQTFLSEKHLKEFANAY